MDTSWADVIQTGYFFIKDTGGGGRVKKLQSAETTACGRDVIPDARSLTGWTQGPMQPRRPSPKTLTPDYFPTRVRFGKRGLAMVVGLSGCPDSAPQKEGPGEPQGGQAEASPLTSMCESFLSNHTEASKFGVKLSFLSPATEVLKYKKYLLHHSGIRFKVEL